MTNNHHEDCLRKVAADADQLLARLGDVGLETEVADADAVDPMGNDEETIKSSVSKRMGLRLASIDKLIAAGYRLELIWEAFPQLVSANGSAKNVWASSPAGFSWIAFFFPFAVCAQIREWSYFYVAGCTYLVCSVFYKISGLDPSFWISSVMAYMYGCIYPYLRWAALRKSRRELPVGISIILGLSLGLLSMLPSIVFEAIFIG